jgi:hypothetical protein
MHLQPILTTFALNLIRLDYLVHKNFLVKTRTSRFLELKSMKA